VSGELIGPLGDLERAGAITPTSLRLSADLDYEQAEMIGRYLGAFRDATAWWLGDYIVQTEELFSHQASQLAEATGRSPETLRVYAWVARAVPPDRRRKRLSFSHHQAVAKYDRAEQERLLDLAERERLSVHEMRGRMFGRPTPRVGGRRAAGGATPSARAARPARPRRLALVVSERHERRLRRAAARHDARPRALPRQGGSRDRAARPLRRASWNLAGRPTRFVVHAGAEVRCPARPVRADRGQGGAPVDDAPDPLARPRQAQLLARRRAVHERGRGAGPRRRAERAGAVNLDEHFREMIAAEVERQLAEREESRFEDGRGWPEWMDVRTAAKYLGCEPGVVRKLVERRRVPYTQEGPGCKVWIARRDLDAYMEAGRRDIRR
jgi:excisionase family DNA binding protein